MNKVVQTMLLNKELTRKAIRDILCFWRRKKVKKFYCNGKQGFCDEKQPTSGVCSVCEFEDGTGGEYKESEETDNENG